jgi:hypothetical protein
LKTIRIYLKTLGDLGVLLGDYLSLGSHQYVPLQMSMEEKPWYVFGRITFLQFTLFVICLVMLCMSFWHGITGDDIVMNEYGKAIIRYFTSFGKDDYVFTNLNGADRDEVISYYGGFFSTVCALLCKILPFDTFTVIHFFNALTGFVAVNFAARFANRYLGQGAAILTALIMFLAPFWLGNAMNNPKDIPFAASYIMGIYYMFRFLEKLPNVSKLDYLWVILSIAVSINIRVAGVLLIPYFFLLLFAVNFWRKYFYHQSIPIFFGFGKVVLIGFISYLSASLLWPWALQNPFVNPIQALTALSNFQVNLTQLWHGEKIMSALLPAYYLPYTFLISNPLIVLIGIIFGILFLLLIKNKKQIQFVLIAFIFFTAFFPMAYVIYKGSNVYHLWRHLLFIFPSIAIIGAFGFHQFASYYNDKYTKLAVICLVAFLFAEPLYFIVKTFPNTICYYNTLVGGTKGAYGYYEVDFYYNSLKESTNWFKKNVVSKMQKTDTITLATNAPHILGEYLKNDSNVKVQYVRFYERHEAKFDYSMFHIALLPEDVIRSGTWTKGKVLYSAKVQSKIMNCIFKKPTNLDAEGMALFNAGKFDEGLPKLKKAFEIDPTNELVAFALIDYYQEMEKIDSAYIYIDKLEALSKQ